MKNIHLIPTDKPSRLYRSINSYLYFQKEPVIDMDIRGKNQNIYITSDEKIKEGDWCINTGRLNETTMFPDMIIGKADYTAKALINTGWKKIILTTDDQLITDGIQAINDEFLEWFVKNPSCEEIELTTYHVKGDISGKLHYKITIPKEEPNPCKQFNVRGVLPRKESKQTDWKDSTKAIMEAYGDNPKDFLYEEPKQETPEHNSKFIVFTYQDSEDWTQDSIPLDSFEKADNFCQHFRDNKKSYLICKTVKQGYNGK